MSHAKALPGRRGHALSAPVRIYAERPRCASITDCRRQRFSGELDACSARWRWREPSRESLPKFNRNLTRRCGGDGPMSGTLGPSREFPHEICSIFMCCPIARGSGRNAHGLDRCQRLCTFPCRAPGAAAPRGDRLDHRHRHRVVLFLSLQHRHGLVFAKLFFPNSDPWVGTLEAFAIYAVGFVARPVGAAIFGHYGDRIGRKSTLIATLLLMGLATFAVALVPTYESIGIWEIGRA